MGRLPKCMTNYLASEFQVAKRRFGNSLHGTLRVLDLTKRAVLTVSGHPPIIFFYKAAELKGYYQGTNILGAKAVILKGNE